MRGKIFTTVCAASSAAFVFSRAAYAGGYVEPVVQATPVIDAPAPVSDWAGAYVGGSLGYVFGSDDVIGLDKLGTVERETGIGAVDIKGVNAGIHAGYRWHRGNWVYGPELGLEGGSIDASDNVAAFGNEYGVESKLNYLVSLRLKAGYEVNLETLVYGTVGVAHGDFDYTLSEAGSSLTEGYSDTAFSAGLGVERKLSERLSLFAEWEYRQFGKTELTFTTDYANLATRATPEHHNIKIGVNYRF